MTAALSFDNPSAGRIAYNVRVFAGLPVIAPVSNVTITPDATKVGSPKAVTVKATVKANNQIATVTLEQVSENGVLIQTLTTMVDNGNLGQGDEIQSDGVYTAILNMTADVAGRVYLRVKAVVGGETRYSGIFSFTINAVLSDASLNSIVNGQKTHENLYWQLIPTQGKQAALDAVLKAVKGDPAVEDAGINEGGQNIWIVYKEGIAGGLMLNDPGEKAGLSGRFVNAASRKLLPGMALASEAIAKAAKPGNTEVGNQKVVVLAPFLFDFVTGDDAPDVNTKFTASTCPKYDVTYKTNAPADVASFKTLSQFGVVHISAHGDTYFKGYQGNWADFWGWFAGGSHVVILTGQQATTANKAANEADLKAGRLAIISGYYTVLPAFIKHYNSNFPDSVVFVSACRSTGNKSMSDAFTGSGAETYLGFSDKVAPSFAKKWVNDFYEKWINDSSKEITTGESFTSGQIETDSDPARWDLYGALNVELPGGNELQNSGFEEGTLSAWTGAGDARVITQLGPFVPTGNFMGIISTGLGFTTQLGSISQKVCIPKEAKTLTFRWNYSSEEFLEYCNTQFQDPFRVIVDGTTVFSRRVDDLCGSVSPAPYSFDRGGVYTTGWLNATVDISGTAATKAGTPVTVTFTNADAGDSIYDTAVLLDEIKINK